MSSVRRPIEKHNRNRGYNEDRECTVAERPGLDRSNHGLMQWIRSGGYVSCLCTHQDAYRNRCSGVFSLSRGRANMPRPRYRYKLKDRTGAIYIIIGLNPVPIDHVLSSSKTRRQASSRMSVKVQGPNTDQRGRTSESLAAWKWRSQSSQLPPALLAARQSTTSVTNGHHALCSDQLKEIRRAKARPVHRHARTDCAGIVEPAGPCHAATMRLHQRRLSHRLFGYHATILD
ncbi:hypothetical protein ANO11243_009400 [Dothideomycetidae sp. 11243]|nr:hypothetical protein ANO11243_009400 [fungal sp. No.11243]